MNTVTNLTHLFNHEYLVPDVFDLTGCLWTMMSLAKCTTSWRKYATQGSCTHRLMQDCQSAKTSYGKRIWPRSYKRNRDEGELQQHRVGSKGISGGGDCLVGLDSFFLKNGRRDHHPQPHRRRPASAQEACAALRNTQAGLSVITVPRERECETGAGYFLHRTRCVQRQRGDQAAQRSTHEPDPAGALCRRAERRESRHRSDSTRHRRAPDPTYARRGREEKARRVRCRCACLFRGAVPGGERTKYGHTARGNSRPAAVPTAAHAGP